MGVAVAAVATVTMATAPGGAPARSHAGHRAYHPTSNGYYSSAAAAEGWHNAIIASARVYVGSAGRRTEEY